MFCLKMVLVNRRTLCHISESSRAKSSLLDPESSLLLGHSCIQGISPSVLFGLIFPSIAKAQNIARGGEIWSP